jgi:hypothetical protein
VVDEIRGALGRLLDFLGFLRSSFGELVDAGERFEVLCSVARDGTEAIPRGPPPPLPWYFGELRTGRMVVLPNIPEDFPPEATAEIEGDCRRTMHQIAKDLRLTSRSADARRRDALVGDAAS